MFSCRILPFHIYINVILKANPRFYLWNIDRKAICYLLEVFGATASSTDLGFVMNDPQAILISQVLPSQPGRALTHLRHVAPNMSWFKKCCAQVFLSTKTPNLTLTEADYLKGPMRNQTMLRYIIYLFCKFMVLMPEFPKDGWYVFYIVFQN